MAKGFASTTDMAEKKITFSEIGTDLYAFTAEGDPNSAIITGFPNEANRGYLVPKISATLHHRDHCAIGPKLSTPVETQSTYASPG